MTLSKTSPPLSLRQKQVFKLLEEGQTIKEIADTLGISVNTVKGHGKMLRKKCGDAPNARTAMYNFHHPRSRK